MGDDQSQLQTVSWQREQTGLAALASPAGSASNCSSSESLQESKAQLHLHRADGRWRMDTSGASAQLAASRAAARRAPGTRSRVRATGCDRTRASSTLGSSGLASPLWRARAAGDASLGSRRCSVGSDADRELVSVAQELCAQRLRRALTCRRVRQPGEAATARPLGSAEPLSSAELASAPSGRWSTRRRPSAGSDTT